MVDVNIPEKGIPCELEGVLEAICVPLTSVESQMQFCAPVVLEHVCIPVFHQLWPDWNLEQKDLIIEKIVATSLEKRILAELSQETFSDDHAAVSGLQLTTTTACQTSYKKFNCRYNFPSCDPDTGEV